MSLGRKDIEIDPLRAACASWDLDISRLGVIPYERGSSWPCPGLRWGASRERDDGRRLCRRRGWAGAIIWLRRPTAFATGAAWYAAIEQRFPTKERLWLPVRAERAWAAILALLRRGLPGELAALVARRALW